MRSSPARGTISPSIAWVRDCAVVARSADGVVEALESDRARNFFIAVQWHPESTVALDGGASAGLFCALVDAAAPAADHR